MFKPMSDHCNGCQFWDKIDCSEVCILHQTPDAYRRVNMEQTFKWHPYPQEKPKEWGRYLVTRMRKVDFDDWNIVTIGKYEDGGPWELSYWECGGLITAWAEIPEPYKEEVEE